MEFKYSSLFALAFVASFSVANASNPDDDGGYISSNGIPEEAKCTPSEHPEEIGVKISGICYPTESTIELDISGYQVTDLELVKHFKNLKLLNASHNDIDDLTPIYQLKNIIYLDLAFTGVTDLYPVSGYSNLEYINVEGWTNFDKFQLNNFEKLRGATLPNGETMGIVK